MKNNKLWGGEYVAPALEEVLVAVESGFGDSYGEEGHAGQSLDVDNYGSF